ncbi:MAG TPA: nitroreductase family protein [Bacteroidales bacterium]|jgi:nitroreductase|nr:nitroreductase family protein [Bacteroidales bacterium]
MEFSDLIRSRESVRNYDPDRPVPPEILTRILDAGRLAPSARNLQPVRFMVISSDDMLEKVRKCYHRDWFKDAPHILVVAGLKDQAWVRSYDGYNSIETDLAIALTHMILAAENEGVATCWIGAFDPTILREALDIPANQVIFGITPLGYPKAGYEKSGIKQRKPLDDIVEYL